MNREPAADAIARHSARGMTRQRLNEIYGESRVLHVLGAERREPEPILAGSVPFAQRLRAAMSARRLSLKRASVLLGVDQYRMNEYLLGESVPFNPRVVAAIAGLMSERADDIEYELAPLRNAAVRAA